MVEPDEGWIFLVALYEGRWYPLLERHTHCKPGHLGCKVLHRMNPAGAGFATRRAAERWLKTWLDENLPGAIWYRN